MDGHGKLRVKTSSDGDFVIAEIVDDGPGIPREAKSRIVTGHGGEIRLNSKPEETRTRTATSRTEDKGWI